MTLNFADYFSAEHAGYDILYQNMKYGLNASKELSEFLRERSAVEETNSKLLAKLAKQANGGAQQGAFAPVWAAFKSSAEKLATLHQHMFQKVGELVKDVSRYADDLHKKHKSVKDSESSTLEIVLAAQSTKQSLSKAKDLYQSKAAEVEKLKKENASAKDLEKADTKLKKLREDYKALSDKYASVKREFDAKMTLTCKHFQDVEELHLKQMKQFVAAYAELVQNNHDLVGQVHVDFKHQCLEMTVEKLLEQFVFDKYNSMDSGVRAAAANDSVSENDQIAAVANGSHAEPRGKNAAVLKLAKKEPTFAQKTSRRTTSLLNLFTPNFQSRDEPGGSPDGAAPCSAPSSPSGTQSGAAPPPADKADETQMGRNPLRESRWFLRSKRAKAKLKKSKKKKDDLADNAGTIEDKSDLEEKEEETASKDLESAQSPEVDEDGYCIRPKDDKGSVYSTSDSDSEEERERKIHVEIKPLSNGAAPMSASVDELVATVENLSLFPVGTARRGSNAAGMKPSSDLLGLNFFQSPTGSNPASPLGSAANPYSSLQSSGGAPPESPTPVGTGDADDGVSESGDASEKRAATPSTSIAIPRPPSRRSETGEFRAGGVTVASRGPSPLTIGMADTIPLAVAFHEIVHCYFKGSDESKCQVKMSGDMMLSFPTGIVGVLANNPNPAKLCFRLKNASKLDNVLPNKQLVCLNPGASPRDTVVEFNMNALTSLLKRQSEKNPGAAYFNVDILKYQIKPKYGASSCPFQLVSYWKCEKSHTDLKIDYKYNLHGMSSPSPLLNLTISVPIEGDVLKINSKPGCQTYSNEESTGLLWKFTELSQHSDDHGVGSLRAHVELESGPSPKSTIVSQFNCEGATLSAVEFELVGSGYRLSLVKRRFVSGKYICDGD